MTEPAPGIPPALAEVLLLVPAEARTRFSTLSEAAVVMMGALADVDLSQFEEKLDSDGPYALWEKLAPLVGESTKTIHTLIQTADELFPAGIVEQFDLVAHAGMIATELSARLKAEVNRFREQMREPSLMSDHWRLLEAVGAFRGKIRARTGGAIFAIARTFQPAANEADVTPYYGGDLVSGLQVRDAVAQLLREIRNAERRSIANGEVVNLTEQCESILRMLERFSTSEAYRRLRISDHRALWDARRNLRNAVEDPTVDADATIRQVIDFLSYLEKINQRDSIIRHDKKAVDEALGHIRRAHDALAEGLVKAGVEAQGALRLMSMVAGRDVRIDELLRRIQIDEVSTLSVDALIAHLGQAEAVLSQLELG